MSKLCDLKPHVLRYWEQEFSQLQPVTRRGNRRYYQQEEVLLIRKIRQLLYFEGFTIQGAKSKLSNRQFLKDTTSKVEIDFSLYTPVDLGGMKTRDHDEVGSTGI